MTVKTQIVILGGGFAGVETARYLDRTAAKRADVEVTLVSRDNFTLFSPGVLRHVTYQGAPLVKGKHVAGFTNGEEEEMHLTKVVPFLVEDELLRLGAIYEKMANWQPFSITDGRLITGQNPASSTSAAQALLKLMTVSESEPSTNSVQIEHKSYEMPPRDGFSVAHFLTVADIDRSARFYETVFGGRILSRGDSKGAPGYIQIANTWLLVNVGGGPDPRQADGNA